MLRPTEQEIEGTMSRRQCSREEALRWLEIVSDPELKEFLESPTLDAYYGRNLGFSNLQIRNYILRRRLHQASQPAI